MRKTKSKKKMKALKQAGIITIIALTGTYALWQQYYLAPLAYFVVPIAIGVACHVATAEERRKNHELAPKIWAGVIVSIFFMLLILGDIKMDNSDTILIQDNEIVEEPWFYTERPVIACNLRQKFDMTKTSNGYTIQCSVTVTLTADMSNIDYLTSENEINRDSLGYHITMKMNEEEEKDNGQLPQGFSYNKSYEFGEVHAYISRWQLELWF